MDTLTRTIKDHPPQYGRDYLVGLVAAPKLARLIRKEGFSLVRLRKGLWQVQDKSGDFPLTICNVYIWYMPKMPTDAAYSVLAAQQYNLMDRVKFEPRQELSDYDILYSSFWRRWK